MCSIHRLRFLKSIIFSSLFAVLSYPSAAAIHLKQEEANQTINALYQQIKHLPNRTMPTRLDVISTQFLGTTYVLGALGEGTKAYFDQEPRYRVDAFDCDTYVTTVLALALAQNMHGFKQCMSKVRYKNGKVGFITRNHFTSLDWNRNNQRQGFVKDITETFKDQNNNSVAKIASALIDRPSWFQHLTTGAIRLTHADRKEQTKRLAKLKFKGAQLPKQLSNIAYLPFTTLFNSHGKPNHYLFAQIPHGAIIEIVRPNWDLREKIGTNLNISHLGFAFWDHGTLYFRQASSQFGHVVNSSLIEYLQNASKNPTIKGINVQIVMPQYPLADGCIVEGTTAI